MFSCLHFASPFPPLVTVTYLIFADVVLRSCSVVFFLHCSYFHSTFIKNCFLLIAYHVYFKRGLVSVQGIMHRKVEVF